jgi:hypothetical protein
MGRILVLSLQSFVQSSPRLCYGFLLFWFAIGSVPRFRFLMPTRFGFLPLFLLLSRSFFLMHLSMRSLYFPFVLVESIPPRIALVGFYIFLSSFLIFFFLFSFSRFSFPSSIPLRTRTTILRPRSASTMLLLRTRSGVVL